jgi:hypothetical protein
MNESHQSSAMRVCVWLGVCVCVGVCVCGGGGGGGGGVCVCVGVCGVCVCLGACDWGVCVCSAFARTNVTCEFAACSLQGARFKDECTLSSLATAKQKGSAKKSIMRKSMSTFWPRPVHVIKST